ncbi:MAG TPA: glycosyltransferase, partial [Afifellaceae bacterium]|nr:glycosyltransferase [Afifellaceae bacterium]
ATAPARLRGAMPGGGLACHRLRAMIPSGETMILHCRGRAASELGLAVRATRPAARVIFDCRGWEGPELLHAHGFDSAERAPPDLRERCSEAEARQRRAARAADAVIVVSDAMRRIAVRQWGVEEARLSVVPCCAETQAPAAGTREATRARLNFDGRLVVVYCGSLARYQAIEATLDAFDPIRRVRCDAFFFGVTPSPETLTARLRERGLRECDSLVVSATHTEVPALLAAGDLALLLRERSPVNEVASPVKFAEYLAAGLPVVLSEGIGDYSALVRREGLGCLLPPPPPPSTSNDRLRLFLEEYDHSADAMRARCRAVAERQLSAGRAADTLADLYRALWRDLTGAEPGAAPAQRAAA